LRCFRYAAHARITIEAFRAAALADSASAAARALPSKMNCAASARNRKLSSPASPGAKMRCGAPSSFNAPSARFDRSPGASVSARPADRSRLNLSRGHRSRLFFVHCGLPSVSCARTAVCFRETRIKHEGNRGNAITRGYCRSNPSYGSQDSQPYCVWFLRVFGR
jgi:hypothetical protein